MKTTPIRNCQSCGKGFADGDIVYYVPIDNNITCPHCASFHGMTGQRLVEIEITSRGASDRYGVLADFLEDNDVELSPTDTNFLRWIAERGDDAADNLFCILKKCLGRGGK